MTQAAPIRKSTEWPEYSQDAKIAAEIVVQRFGDQAIDFVGEKVNWAAIKGNVDTWEFWLEVVCVLRSEALM